MIEKKDMIKFIEEEGASVRGKREYLKHLKGESLTLKQAQLAHCYSCSLLEDGRKGCTIFDCELYPFMAYNPNKKKESRPMTEEQKKVLSDRMKNMRRGKKK